MQVWEFMSAPVTTIREDAQLAVVEGIMSQERIRHLPVVDGEGRLVGIISQRDLFRAALERVTRARGAGEQQGDPWTVCVREVTHRQVRTVHRNETIQEAAGRMYREKIGCLPVVEDGRVHGIITEHDILKIVANLELE